MAEKRTGDGNGATEGRPKRARTGQDSFAGKRQGAAPTGPPPPPMPPAPATMVMTMQVPAGGRHPGMGEPRGVTMMHGATVTSMASAAAGGRPTGPRPLMSVAGASMAQFIPQQQYQPVAWGQVAMVPMQMGGARPRGPPPPASFSMAPAASAPMGAGHPGLQGHLVMPGGPQPPRQAMQALRTPPRGPPGAAVLVSQPPPTSATAPAAPRGAQVVPPPGFEPSSGGQSRSLRIEVLKGGDQQHFASSSPATRARRAAAAAAGAKDPLSMLAGIAAPSTPAAETEPPPAKPAAADLSIKAPSGGGGGEQSGKKATSAATSLATPMAADALAAMGADNAQLLPDSPPARDARGRRARPRRASARRAKASYADMDDGGADEGSDVSPERPPKVEEKSTSPLSTSRTWARGAGRRWTDEEDADLRRGVEETGARNWKHIAAKYLQGRRTEIQCLHRWNKVLRPGLVKGPWQPGEDDTIRLCIEAGITKWSEIADRIPGRLGKQCRERWHNHLMPGVRKAAWSEEEDKLIVSEQARLGNKWCEIAKALPGRSENAVKNRWNSAVFRRKYANQGNLPPASEAPRGRKRKAAADKSAGAGAKA